MILKIYRKRIGEPERYSISKLAYEQFLIDYHQTSPNSTITIITEDGTSTNIVKEEIAAYKKVQYTSADPSNWEKDRAVEAAFKTYGKT